jgi:peptidoglycan/xylan/chitin deacetylase (PgdA/CDA1 family)
MKTVKTVLLCLLLISIGFICTYILYNGSAVQTVNTEENGVKIPVIMYHNISEKKRLWNTYTISPEQIEQDIIYLKDNGYTTVSCAEVLSWHRGEGTLPDKPVMLTVDDGFESFYAYMYPLLKRYGCKAVISPIGSCTDAYSAEEDHNLDYSYLTWEELKEMNDSGLVEIGNHTYNLHGDKGGRVGCGRKYKESDTDYKKLLTEDIGKMQTEIKSYTATDCKIFTYPYGKVSDGSREILEGMGFELFFTCNGKINTLTQGEGSVVLGRFNRPSGKTTREFMKGLK